MRAAAFLAAILCTACGKSDDGERTEAASAAKTPAPAAPTAEPPGPADDPEPTAADNPAAPVEPSKEEQATAEKAADALDELGKIAEAAKGNCDKAATAMKAVIDKNRAALAGAEKLGQDEGKEQWLADRFGPRTDAAKSKLMPLMEKCADHEGIANVFESIE
jgi:hypothetical protein